MQLGVSNWVTWVSRVVLLVLGASVPGYLIWWGGHAVANARAFAVREVVVSGHEHLTREEVLAAAALRDGRNRLTVRVDELEERLSAHPWIRHASVRMNAGGVVLVDIAEARPVAVLVTDQPWLVDSEGLPIVPLTEGTGDPEWVWYAGFLRDHEGLDGSATAAQLAAHLDQRGLLDAMAKVEELAAEGFAGDRAVTEYQRLRDGSIRLTLRGGVEVRLRDEEWALRIARVLATLEHFGPTSAQQLDYIAADGNVLRQVAVRYRGATAETTAVEAR